jgi:hypothetical protein
MLAVDGIRSITGGTNARYLFIMLSVINSVHSEGYFLFLHRERVFLITLRGAKYGAESEQQNKIRKKKGSSYIGRAIMAVD